MEEKKMRMEKKEISFQNEKGRRFSDILHIIFALAIIILVVFAYVDGQFINNKVVIIEKCGDEVNSFIAPEGWDIVGTEYDGEKAYKILDENGNIVTK